MAGYEKGDKVVVQIKNNDNNEPKYDVSSSPYGHWISDYDILGKLEEFQPKDEKIVMTPDEKAEFDELYPDGWQDVSDFLDEINDCADDYPNLYKRLYSGGITNNFHSQIECVKALEKPSRIEVVKPEYEFKVGDLVKERFKNKKAVIIAIHEGAEYPIKISYKDGVIDLVQKEDISFIKSNAIDWG